MPRFPVVRHDSLYNGSNFVVRTDVSVPRFDEVSEEALAFLRREGYVVLKGVLDANDLKTARELLWQYLEGISGARISRHNPASWVRARPNQYGILWNYGSGHSRLAWFIRTRPQLLKLFQRYWNTTDLLASFEGFSMLPPARLEQDWMIGESWFHTDQNAKSRPGLQTIQSFTSLYDQSPATGGFVVVPRSWRQHKAVTRRVYQFNPRTPDAQQFLMIPPDDPVLSPPHFVRCAAGDAVLWDSRTVHCSTPSLRGQPDVAQSDGDEPARVVVYGSMAPRRFASDQVLRQRQRALLIRQTCTHWPFDFACLDPPNVAGETPSDPLPVASGLVKSLVGYTDEQITRWLRGGRDRSSSSSSLPADPFLSPRPLTLEMPPGAEDEAPAAPRGRGKCLRGRGRHVRRRHVRRVLKL